MRKNPLLWTVPGLLIGVFGALPLLAAVPPHSWSSDTIALRADIAAKAMKESQYGQAESAYRALIGLDPKEEDFYLGLYSAAFKAEHWDAASLALEELIEKKPEVKTKISKQLKEIFEKTHRATDAKKLAPLVAKADPAYIDTRVTALIDKSILPEVKEEVKPPPPPRKEVKPEDVHAHTSKFGLTFLNAYQSESIVVAEYVGMDKSENVTYFKPPRANYRIKEYLKGPPLNPFLPVRYEFHDVTGGTKPEGWKFDEAKMMPKKGSKWIIFIPNAVPIDGSFETYHGNFGRQEYNDENLDKILKILEEHKGQVR